MSQLSRVLDWTGLAALRLRTVLSVEAVLTELTGAGLMLGLHSVMWEKSAVQASGVSLKCILLISPLPGAIQPIIG